VRVLTEDALLTCAHPGGVVSIAPTQELVTIAGRRMLVEPNPEGRRISGCTNAAPPMKPCTKTLPVTNGYSTFVRIGGHRVCLDTVTGLTDGMMAGTVKYVVRKPGQQFVAADA